MSQKGKGRERERESRMKRREKIRNEIGTIGNKRLGYGLIVSNHSCNKEFLQLFETVTEIEEEDFVLIFDIQKNFR